MATMTVTKDKGGAGRPAGMTVILPSQEVPLEALQTIGKDAGLNGVVLADLISAMATHQRHAAHVARAAANETNTLERRKLHEGLAKMYKERVGALESLLDKLGVPRLYVSPRARMAGFIVEHSSMVSMLAGSIDPETLEVTLLNVAFTLAEQSLADMQALEAIAKAAQPSTAKTALDKTVKALSGDTATIEKIRTARMVGLALSAMVKNP